MVEQIYSHIYKRYGVGTRCPVSAGLVVQLCRRCGRIARRELTDDELVLLVLLPGGHLYLYFGRSPSSLAPAHPGVVVIVYVAAAVVFSGVGRKHFGVMLRFRRI